MRLKSSWVLLLPALSFVIASWLYVHSQSDIRIQFERAQEKWRRAEYDRAIRAYTNLYQKSRTTEYGARALWEIATIYYFNLYDVSNALHYFNRLTVEFPHSEWTVESHLKLAEIFALELNEPVKAIEHWQLALQMDLLPEKRQEIEFRIADSHFKRGETEVALGEFTKLSAAAVDPHLKRRIQLRIATIMQVRKDHNEAIKRFLQVLEGTECDDCRLQAQLGLIESYEVQDQLTEAIKVAEQIDPTSYPAQVRQDLLNRLAEKQKIYEPRLWSGR